MFTGAHHGLINVTVEVKRRIGRPRKKWSDTTRDDLQTWSISMNVANDRDAWRGKLRAAILERVARTYNVKTLNSLLRTELRCADPYFHDVSMDVRLCIKSIK